MDINKISEAVLKQALLDNIFGEETYSEKVSSALIDIITESNKISEKAFASVDKVITDVRMFMDHPDVMEVVSRFDSEERPEFCAELLYSRAEFTK